MFGESEATEQRIGLLAYLFVAQTINSGEQTDVFGHGKVFVERELLTHVANVSLDLLVFGANIVARHTTFPAGGWLSPVSMCMAVVLPAPLAPEETEDFAPFHTERDVVDGAEIAEWL